MNELRKHRRHVRSLRLFAARLRGFVRETQWLNDAARSISEAPLERDTLIASLRDESATLTEQIEEGICDLLCPEIEIPERFGARLSASIKSSVKLAESCAFIRLDSGEVQGTDLEHEIILERNRSIELLQSLHEDLCHIESIVTMRRKKLPADGLGIHSGDSATTGGTLNDPSAGAGDRADDATLPKRKSSEKGLPTASSLRRDGETIEQAMMRVFTQMQLACVWWTQRDWAEKFGCAPSAIAGTKTWRAIQQERAAQKGRRKQRRDSRDDDD